MAASVRRDAHSPGKKPCHDLYGTEILDLSISEAAQSSEQRLGLPVGPEHLADAIEAGTEHHELTHTPY